MPQHPAHGARSSLAFLLAIALLALLTGCGGGSSTNNKVASITIGFPGLNGVFNTLTTQSLQQGQTFQLSTQIKNPKGVIITPTPVFSSSNSQIAAVSTTGDVCGGTWDVNFINCTPGPSGSATITASTGGQSATVTIDVHSRISKVTLTPASSPNNCSSQTHTLQYTLAAFDAIGNPVTSPGPASYSVSDNTVATVDTNGLVTAKNPGATAIFGNVAGITSAPAAFVTCPPQSIVLHQSTDPAGTFTTNFNVAIGASIPLIADVTDTLGNPVTGLGVSLFSSQPAAASVSGTTLSAIDNSFATVVASCLPPGCNPSNGTSTPGTGQALYSNLVRVTITGTALNTTAYVTGITAADGTATNTSLLPIAVATNTAGTAITLPGVPNSMAFSPNGNTLYIGTAAGLAVLTTSTNTLSPAVTNATGSILAVSPSGTQVVLNDAANSRALLYDTATSMVTPVESIAVPNSATFSPDGYKLFISANGNVFEFTAGGPTHQTPFASNITTVTSIPQGVAAYASPTATAQVSSIATCNNSVLTSPSIASAPALLAPAPDGSELIGISSSWLLLPYTVASSLCLPAVSEGTANTPAYAGPAPTQLIISAVQNYAAVTAASSAPGSTLNLLNLQNGTPTTAALAVGTGTLTTGGFTLDGTKFYAGVKGGTAGNAVHLFDLSQLPPVDTTQINTTFTPDFVAVKP